MRGGLLFAVSLGSPEGFALLLDGDNGITAEHAVSFVASYLHGHGLWHTGGYQVP
jgi:hypothetical protein